VWIGTIAALWLFQEAIVFPGWWLRREDETLLHAFAERQGFRVVWTPAEDGADVVLWVHDTGADRAILFWHGNGELVADHAALAQRLGDLGWDFVGVELRGFGDSSGWPREATLNRDASAAWTWASDRYEPSRIVLHGRSVGGGPAARLASDAHPAGLILESTFDSLAAVAQKRVPFVPGMRWLLRTPYETTSLTLDLPVLQIHSEDDEVIGIGHARALRATLGDVTVAETRGYGHNDSVLLRDDTVRDAWERWLEAVVPK
jgi:pimeloyl-ACP methyl ester carboxylesterase